MTAGFRPNQYLSNWASHVSGLGPLFMKIWTCLQLVSFLVWLRIYKHPCKTIIIPHEELKIRAFSSSSYSTRTLRILVVWDVQLCSEFGMKIRGSVFISDHRQVAYEQLETTSLLKSRRYVSSQCPDMLKHHILTITTPQKQPCENCSPYQTLCINQYIQGFV